MGNTLRKTLFSDIKEEATNFYNKGIESIKKFIIDGLLAILEKLLSNLMLLEEELQTIRLNTFKMVSTARIPYEQFLQQYGLLLRGEGHSSHTTLTSNLESEGENKENELLFEPLDMLYKKQLKLTPRRKSTTPKRRLRRRAGKFIFQVINFECVVFS